MDTLNSPIYAVRKAALNDAKMIELLWREMADSYHQVEPRAWILSHNPPILSWVEREIANTDGILLVATVDNVVVGFIRGFSKKAMGGLGQGYSGVVTHLMVTAPLRRKGLATSLVESTKKIFRADGVQEISASVYINNKSGLAFWKRVGLVPLTKTLLGSL